MKKRKIYLLLAILFAPVLLWSCGQDFQCTCTDSQGKVTVTSIDGATRAEAKISCESVTIAGETCVLD